MFEVVNRRVLLHPFTVTHLHALNESGCASDLGTEGSHVKFNSLT